MSTIEKKLTDTLVDSQSLIEGGWIGFQKSVVPKDASQVQIDEMRKAFFAGAAHLFFSIMTFLDSDREPTAQDLRRMEMVHKELEEFQRQLIQEVTD